MEELRQTARTKHRHQRQNQSQPHTMGWVLRLRETRLETRNEHCVVVGQLEKTYRQFQCHPDLWRGHHHSQPPAATKIEHPVESAPAVHRPRHALLHAHCSRRSLQRVRPSCPRWLTSSAFHIHQAVEAGTANETKIKCHRAAAKSTSVPVCADLLYVSSVKNILVLPVIILKQGSQTTSMFLQAAF